jgi:hypothetical protein
MKKTITILTGIVLLLIKRQLEFSVFVRGLP